MLSSRPWSHIPMTSGSSSCTSNPSGVNLAPLLLRSAPQSYYVGLWDWTRGNGTVIFDYEARPVGQLPIGLDPLPFEREPLTWMTTLYRKDWLAAARALVSTPASGGARTQQQQAPGVRRSMVEYPSLNASAGSGLGPQTIGGDSGSGGSGTSTSRLPPADSGAGAGASRDAGGSSITAAAASSGGSNPRATTPASAAAEAPAEPRTWEELLTLAAAVEGRDMDGDGQPDHGLCLDLARGADRDGGGRGAAAECGGCAREGGCRLTTHH